MMFNGLGHFLGSVLSGIGQGASNIAQNVAHPSNIVNNLEGQFIAHSPNQLGHTIPAPLPQHQSISYSDPNDPTLAFRNKFVADTFAHQAANRLPMARPQSLPQLHVTSAIPQPGNGVIQGSYQNPHAQNYDPMQAKMAYQDIQGESNQDNPIIGQGGGAYQLNNMYRSIYRGR